MGDAKITKPKKTPKTPRRPRNKKIAKDAVTTTVNKEHTKGYAVDIKLGNDKKIQVTNWKGETRVDIRQWAPGSCNAFYPTQRGVSLNVRRFKTLCEVAHEINEALRRVSGRPMSHLSTVKHVILVMSGKGGVGKSTVATQLACCLTQMGSKVGLLDVDLCGPNVPKMLNIEGHSVHQCPEGWVPVFVDKDQKLSVMSIAFMLEKNSDAVIWRGPKKTSMIKQFLNDVYWRDIDYLIIDTPPGTSDEHIAVVETLKPYNPDGAILVTTPQAVAVGDVRRELTFCKKTGIPVLGIVENMSGFVCPHCTECTNIFSKGGGEALAKHSKVSFLGCIPIDPHLTQHMESGHSMVDVLSDSPAIQAIRDISNKLKLIDRDLP